MVMKKRKGDVALQQSIINIALMIVAALMILLAVYFVQKVLSSRSNMGQQETFSNFVDRIQDVHDNGPYDNSGVAVGSVIVSIDKGFRIYGFDNGGVSIMDNQQSVPWPAECDSSPCFCMCEERDCRTDGKIVDCKKVNMGDINTFVADTDMFNNRGDPHAPGEYVDIEGSTGFLDVIRWNEKAVYFKFENDVLTFDTKSFT